MRLRSRLLVWLLSEPSAFREKDLLELADTTRKLDLELEPPLERGLVWSRSFPSPLLVVPARLLWTLATDRSLRFFRSLGFELKSRFSFL